MCSFYVFRSMMGADWKLVAVSLIQCILGYDAIYHMVSLNVLEPFVRQLVNDSLELNYGATATPQSITWIWSSIATSWMIGYMFMAFAVDIFAERLGRRFSVGILKNLILIVGSVMQFFSRRACSFELLLIGRLITGAAGPFSDYSGTFIAECAPADHRGLVSSLPSVGFRVWVVFSVCMGLPHVLGTEQLWPVVLLVPVVAAVIQIAVTPLHYESPKHLFITENDPDKAAKAVRFYHGPDADVTAVFQEYLAEHSLRPEKATLSVVWNTKHLKWPLIIMMTMSAVCSFEGTDVVNQYSDETLSDGATPMQAALGTLLFIQVPPIFITFLSVMLLSYFGRRPMYFLGLGTAITGTFLIALTGFESLYSTSLMLAGMSLIVIGDCLGPSTIHLFMAGELCPQRSRSLSVSMAFTTESLLSTIIILVYPPVRAWLGNLAMLFFTVMASICFVFLWINLPETRNKTVEEVARTWLEGPNEETPLFDKNASDGVTEL